MDNLIPLRRIGKCLGSCRINPRASDIQGDIVIGNDVWIGHGALILSRLSTGDGSVIDTVDVAKKNVEDCAIVAGNPAKFIKCRLDEDCQKELQKLC